MIIKWRLKTRHVSVVLPHILHRGGHRCCSSDEIGKKNQSDIPDFLKSALKWDKQDNILHTSSVRKYSNHLWTEQCPVKINTNQAVVSLQLPFQFRCRFRRSCGGSSCTVSHVTHGPPLTKARMDWQRVWQNTLTHNVALGDFMPHPAAVNTHKSTKCVLIHS